MAWKEVSPVEERVRFVLAVTQERESMTALCRAYGVSRKTGYKWLQRYEEAGLSGLHDRSRRPRSSPGRVSADVEQLVLRERQRHPHWGPKKLRHRLVAKHGLTAVPAVSTVGNLLRRQGLTVPRKRRRSVTQPAREHLTPGTRPNEVWALDFKGWFRTQDGQRCEVLTASDLYSRYVLVCRLVSGQRVEDVQPVLRTAFVRHGLPEVIRVDNGSPFGSRGVCGLSQLSVWWLRLGIRVEFLEPGHPEQNGSHERMHRTLKQETTRPPAATPRAQQRRSDRWRREFNRERPHEALDLQTPAQRYQRSARRYHDQLPRETYPPYFEVRTVRRDGSLKWQNRLRYVGEALHGVTVGLVEAEPGQQEVYFGELLLGALDDASADGLRPAVSTRQPTAPTLA